MTTEPTWREALEFAAETKSSDWPERCQQMVNMARAALMSDLKQKPTAWTLKETIEAKGSLYRAPLWFTDPQNTAWVPLYTTGAPPQDKAVPWRYSNPLFNDSGVLIGYGRPDTPPPKPQANAGADAPQQAEAVQYTRADLDRAYSAGLVEGERLAIQQAEAVPVAVVKYQVGGLVVHIVGDVQEGDELFKTPQQAEAVPSDVVRDSERMKWIIDNARITSEHWGGRWSIVLESKAPDSLELFSVNPQAAVRRAIDAAIAQQKGGV